jgi:hypothetical protein
LDWPHANEGNHDGCEYGRPLVVGQAPGRQTEQAIHQRGTVHPDRFNAAGGINTVVQRMMSALALVVASSGTRWGH